MQTSWKDEPINLTVEINKFAKKDLPILIGKHTKLDEQIAELLKQSSEEFCWLYKDRLLSSKIVKTINKYAGDCDGADVCIEALSTGYYDSGKLSGPPKHCYPPEGDDERQVQSVELRFYDDGELKNTVKFDAIEGYQFEIEFQEELYEVELPSSVYERFGHDIYETYKDRLI